MIPAQRLARLPGCWREGMRTMTGRRAYTIRGCALFVDERDSAVLIQPSGSRHGDVPDLTDPATIGCLAAWCREVYGLHMYASTDGGYWYVSALYPDGADVWGMSPAWRVVTEGHDTEGDAWAAAILAKLEPK